MQEELEMEHVCRETTESAELGELFGALAKAQATMEAAAKDSANPFFKSTYADLASVVKASRKALAANGLCVIQTLGRQEGYQVLRTRLGHSSGQWMESVMQINPPKNDVQTLGSYITYLRRYAYGAICGVVAASEDDDAETVMVHTRGSQAAKEGGKTIERAQLEILSRELEGHPDLVEEVLSKMKLSKLADLPANQFTKVLERIREIKETKNEMDQ